jgi:hypothetical protein
VTVNVDQDGFQVGYVRFKQIQKQRPRGVVWFLRERYSGHNGDSSNAG